MLGRALFISSRIICRRNYTKFAHKCVYKMNIAYFKTIDDRCNISFRYVNKGFNVDRIFNFSRSLSENVDICLERIRTNVEKEVSKKIKNKTSKKKKGKPVEEPAETTAPSSTVIPTIEVEFFKNENKLKDVVFSQILTTENGESDNFTLRVFEDEYEVVFNCPWVNEIKLPTSILANYFVYPAQLDLEFTTREQCEFIWYRDSPKDNPGQIVWEKVGTGFTYQASSTDIGHLLKVVCIPKNEERDGPLVETISKCEVQADPGRCPFDWRHEFTCQRLQGTKFRIVHYNLLADLYADSDYSREVLFPYCPPYALNIDYRKQLFIKEILGYHGDIMCLCEVDDKIFRLDLSPVFSNRGYDGVFQMKGTTGEGLATFYNSNRFELLEKRGLNIGENVPKLPEFSRIWENVKQNEALTKRLTDRSTALQVTLFRVKDKANRLLLVANTHLYFHPDADHVRLLQAGLAMCHVERVIEEVKQTYPTDEVGFIFCGDFNSVPECGIYKLMTEKFVPADFVDWTSNEAEAVKGLTLSQPFEIKSAYSPDIPFTNFTPGFTATLDWIFYQSTQLEVDEVVPLPSEEELKPHQGLPSIVSPSDHLALVATFDWK